MLFKIFNTIKKPLIFLMISAIMAVSVPQQSYAVFGAGDTVIVVGDVSPSGITNFINHQMRHLKDFVLDKLATLIAKQILHQLTVSVVNWINTGFEGSPSFLTNPGAFFLDVADQVTGAFLATNGPLSALCSPFTIDIRLSLALSQTALSNQRYTCTLGKIIEAQQNGPNIVVNGQVIRSASTMKGFMGGDFNQGGWPAFMAITTEPQNNPYGAFLSAQGDLYAQIGQKQNTIKADLQLGQGFMSWQSCKDVPGGTFDPNDDDQYSEASQVANDDPSMTIKNNKDGTQTFQNCETQTPGSVIAGTLQTNLNVPVVELELANDINAVVNALVTQMVSTMLSSGLHALSGGSNGGGQSYTQQIINDANSTNAAQGSLNSLQSSISSAIEQVDSYIAIYEQALSALTDSKNRYINARSCYEGKYPSTNAKWAISTINYKIDNDVNQAINVVEAKHKEALADRKKLEDMSYSISGTGSTAQVQAQSQKYADFVQGGGLDVQSIAYAAQSALSSAQSQAQTFNSDADMFLKQCYAAF